MSSQKSSRISCAAIMFSSRMMCSTCSSVRLARNQKPVAPPPGAPNRQAREAPRTLIRAVASCPASSSLAMSLRIWRSCSSRRFRSSLIRGIVSFSSVLLRARPPARSTREPNQDRNRTNRTDNRSSTRNPPTPETEKPRAHLPLGAAEAAAAAALEEGVQHRHGARLGVGWGAVVWEAATRSEARERRGDLRVGGSI